MMQADVSVQHGPYLNVATYITEKALKMDLSPSTKSTRRSTNQYTKFTPKFEQVQLYTKNPILCAAPKFILTIATLNKKDSFVLFDSDRTQHTIRSELARSVLEAIWFDKLESFLLLTEEAVWILNPHKKSILEVNSIKSNKLFKKITSKNGNLIIVYDEWGPTSLHEWSFNEEKQIWEEQILMQVDLNQNEFIEDLKTVWIDNTQNLVMIVYDNLDEQWLIILIGVGVTRRMALCSGSVTDRFNLLVDNGRNGEILCLIYSPNMKNVLTLTRQCHLCDFNCDYHIEKLDIFADKWLVIRNTSQLHFVYARCS